MVQAEMVRQLLRHRHVLQGFVLALVGDAQLAEELFQDVSVAILEEAEKGVELRDFMAWSRQIARHRVADHYRRTGRERGKMEAYARLADAIEHAYEQQAEVGLATERRLRWLADCRGRLARRAREIVRRRYDDHQSLREIASGIGWKETAVKVALAKARRALAECIQHMDASHGEAT